MFTTGETWIFMGQIIGMAIVIVLIAKGPADPRAALRRRERRRRLALRIWYRILRAMGGRRHAE